ncbi:endonuclease/exonuclease/phosphatase family protein [Rhodococcus marinonascens]|uniref:endonuclease/exonuclease/phosphatase family protein n=1 Tax=Rhodococcus marinonascens TaxID=38311 RepID=UPI000A68ACEB|nr:endonuclease/exonuclease/phosphatase family protein [Rhodococcus marinonascens]
MRAAVTWGARALAALGWLAVAVGVLGVALRFFDVQNQRLLILASAAPYLMAGAAVGVVLLGLTRHWVGFAVALTVAVAATLSQGPLYVANDTVTASGPKLTVMQANIWLGNADAASLVRQIRDRDVDVLAVNELTPEAVDRLVGAGIESTLPFSFLMPGIAGEGTGIWSRYSLSDKVHYSEFILSALSARVNLSDDVSTALYAFHPVPPWPTDPSVWSGEMDRIEAILDAIPADSGPVIVSGDFNATRDHVKYRNLVTGRYRDAADQAGAGIQNTYPADRQPFPPMIAIDHIAMSGAQAQSVESVVLEGSDHRGLIAKIVLAN